MKQRTVCVENESLVMYDAVLDFVPCLQCVPWISSIFSFSYFTAVTYDAFIGIERKMLIKMKNEMKSNKNIYLSEI